MGNIVYDEESVELSIILPLLSKGLCLESLLKLLTLDINVNYEILIVLTADELDPYAIKRIEARYPIVKWLDKSPGISTANALKNGIREAAGKYILIVCADIMGPEIPVSKMLGLVRDGCDFVSGTRYEKGGRRLGGPYFATALSQIANKSLHFLGGSTLTDCTTGLKLFRKEVFEQLHCQTNSVGWVIAFEMALKAQSMALTVGEVPFVSIDRLYGGSIPSQSNQEFPGYLRLFAWGLFRMAKLRKKNAIALNKQRAIVDEG